MAGGIADREQDRLAGRAGLGERRLAPGAPMHRVVLVLEQIGARLLAEQVAFDPLLHGSFLLARPRITQWSARSRHERHHRRAGERRRPRGRGGDPHLRAGHARRARGALRRRAASRATLPCATSRSARRRDARSRPGAVVPGAGELHRRGHGRASGAWQPRRGPGVLDALLVRSPARGSPSLASSRAAPSRTASSISPRSKASPISINAETEAQRRQALAQSEGSLRQLYEGWRARAARRAGADRGRARLRRRGRRRRSTWRSRPTRSSTSLLAVDRAPSRRPSRRASARRLAHRHRRSAERRQVEPA